VSRRHYIDRARGIAVLLMILAHVLDAWTLPAARNTIAYRNLIILGGFAAPLFLFLAGASAMLAAERTRGVAGRWPGTMARRGLTIFGLAFLFRLQAFVVSPGGHLVDLLRVDILNVMGLSLAAVGLTWHSTRSTPSYRLPVFLASAVLAAVLAPLVRAAAWVDQLPDLVQWYLRPAGEHTTFTLFPWSGFVFAGAAWGAVLTAPTSPSDRRISWWSVAAGTGLVAAGALTASQPQVFVGSTFWGSSPTFFMIRVGVLLLVVAALYLADRAFRLESGGAIERLGRGSLLVYWVHVELVYGYATWLIHRRLPLPAVLAAGTILTACMYGSLVLRDRIANNWRSRPAELPLPT
jgi:uncharacterized membrane protein